MCEGFMTKILVIEDMKEARATLRLQLRSMNVNEVVEAADGEEALLLLDFDHDFDLILCDWHMKPMDGLQFCILARRHRERMGKAAIPIVLLSGDSRIAEPEHRSRAMAPALDIGIVDILAKPLRLHDLREVVARHTAGPAPGA
jgi:two-component system, chemotaxis family, chemotaxis protein CheY